jgi:hypothetical protein
VEELTAHPLKLPADIQLNQVQVHRGPGQADHLALAQAHHEDQHVRGVERITITDSKRASARACPRHAVTALDGITGAHVDWTDSRGLNEWERKALELSEERSKLVYGISTIRGPRVTNGLTAQTERLWYPDRTTLVPPGTKASRYQRHPASGQGDHVSARWLSRLESRT